MEQVKEYLFRDTIMGEVDNRLDGQPTWRFRMGGPEHVDDSMGWVYFQVLLKSDFALRWCDFYDRTLFWIPPIINQETLSTFRSEQMVRYPAEEIDLSAENSCLNRRWLVLPIKTVSNLF